MPDRDKGRVFAAPQDSEPPAAARLGRRHDLDRSRNQWVANDECPRSDRIRDGPEVQCRPRQTLRQLPLVIAGLVLGKQVGITVATWIAVKSGAATLPENVSWRHIYGASMLAGIGFTMSLFVGDLAFSGADETGMLTSAKLGILVASLDPTAPQFR